MTLFEQLETKYASPDRASIDQVQRQHQSRTAVPFALDLLNTVPDGLVILNAERQIVYTNDRFRQVTVGLKAMEIIGQRPGEALNCIHAHKMKAGCGTSEFCSTCGAVRAILQAQRGEQNVQECRITRTGSNQQEESLDLRVLATPITYNDEPYTVFAVQNISHEKRRNILERVFFHDIMNTAFAIRGLADLMGQSSDLNELAEFEFDTLLDQASVQLIDEIEAQRQLVAAENNELKTDPTPVQTLRFLQEVTTLYQRHPVAEKRFVHLDANVEDLKLVTDRGLLKRVISNMIKNALEACKPGQTVTVGCNTYKGMARFWVYNPNYIPRHIQLQIFQRSFSTKGVGRGLGTYSMKLLSENYLHGSVSFQSSEKSGTVFLGLYPLAEE